MPAKIAILLDKLSNLNCGLGRVTLEFSQALLKEKCHEFEFVFILKNNSNSEYLKNKNIKTIHPVNRYIPFHLPGCKVFHALHQLPSYRIAEKCKKIFTIHDLNFIHVKSKTKAGRYLKRIQHNIDQADAIVFVSYYTQNECLKYLDIPKEKMTTVIYNGVNMPAEEPVKPDFLNQHDDFLFTIGQFLYKKNFHVLIPFMLKIDKKIKLVIAGENNTSYGHYIKKTIADNRLQQRILLPGAIPDSEKLYLYQNCKAFLFPSLAEGFGLPVLEAMRAGKPVFCSDKTSLREIGSHHAFYWSSFHADEMLHIFYSGLEAFNNERKEAALNYSLQFTWQENAKQYIRLYQSLSAEI